MAVIYTASILDIQGQWSRILWTVRARVWASGWFDAWCTHKHTRNDWITVGSGGRTWLIRPALLLLMRNGGGAPSDVGCILYILIPISNMHSYFFFLFLLFCIISLRFVRLHSLHQRTHLKANPFGFVSTRAMACMHQRIYFHIFAGRACTSTVTALWLFFLFFGSLCCRSVCFWGKYVDARLCVAVVLTYVFVLIRDQFAHTFNACNQHINQTKCIVIRNKYDKLVSYMLRSKNSKRTCTNWCFLFRICMVE